MASGKSMVTVPCNYCPSNNAMHEHRGFKHGSEGQCPPNAVSAVRGNLGLLHLDAFRYSLVVGWPRACYGGASCHGLLRRHLSRAKEGVLVVMDPWRCGHTTETCNQGTPQFLRHCMHSPTKAGHCDRIRDSGTAGKRTRRGEVECLSGGHRDEALGLQLGEVEWLHKACRKCCVRCCLQRLQCCQHLLLQLLAFV